jgi:hypothetical protein
MEGRAFGRRRMEFAEDFLIEKRSKIMEIE